jgi:ATP-binding cassette, subfamily B (MDR/TAP), member 1
MDGISASSSELNAIQTLTRHLQFAFSISAIRITKAIRIATLQQTLRQDIGYFDTHKTSSISVQVTTNGNLINNGISEKLGLIIQAISTFIAAFAVAFAVNWKLTLITICIVPTIIIVTAICIGIDSKQEARILPMYSQAGTLAEEVFGTMKTVQAFWSQPKFSAKYEKILVDARTEGFKKSPNYGVLFSTEYFCILSGYGLAFWQGIRRYSSGEIKQSGDVVTVIFAVIVAATALTQLDPQFLFLSKAASAAEELYDILDRRTEIDSLSDTGKRLTSCKGQIEFQNVHFAYPARENVAILKGLTLHVPANKTTALVGASGCGKSTIVGLLERWYNFSKGSIALDGNMLSELNLQWLRTTIRLVGQEPVLFQGSIFDNVAHGLEGTHSAMLPDKEKLELVKKACKDAYADEFIQQMPQGYHTILTEQGGLSGGQKQRIAIARAIISEPRILLLDEATSGLDARSERIVQEALDLVSADRTTIVIAHRLSTIRRADNIAVISNGTVLEQGSHQDLMQLEGAYYRLVKAQDIGQQLDSDDDSNEQDDLKETEPTLAGSETMASGSSNVAGSHGGRDEREGPDGFHYNLMQTVWISIKDQRRIWPHLLTVGIFCVAAGEELTPQSDLGLKFC